MEENTMRMEDVDKQILDLCAGRTHLNQEWKSQNRLHENTPMWSGVRGDLASTQEGQLTYLEKKINQT